MYVLTSNQVSSHIECIWCIFSETLVRKDGINCLLEWWVSQRGLVISLWWNEPINMIMESSVKTFLGHQTASAVFAAPKHLYASCICLLNKTHVLCMGMGAGTSEQALFVATKTWERVQNREKCLWAKERGVLDKSMCLESAWRRCVAFDTEPHLFSRETHTHKTTTSHIR